MNRLTKRTTCGTANLAYPESCYFKSGAKDQIAVSAYRQQAIERLAEYEDMEEQGLLIRLPCKLGIPVYCLMGDGIYSETVERICVSDMGFYLETENMGFDESDFGKYVFLTREAAERALEGNNESTV